MNTRRQLLRHAAFGAVAALAGHEPANAKEARRGRVRLSLCKPKYLRVPLDEMCRITTELGFESMELVEVEDLPTLKKHGLASAAVRFPAARGPNGEEVGRFVHSFSQPEFHDLLVRAYEPVIRAVGEFGGPHVMCFAGARQGRDDETGLKHCTAGLQRIMPLAAKYGVTLLMELLNSKINHPDYFADHTAWGVELARRVGSPNFRLLYDIYHMQIMEGDVIATIRANREFIAHFHAAGVPGRHEIDDSQELNYPAIIRAIADTGYKGFIGMEFSPTHKDPLESLRQAVRICDV